MSVRPCHVCREWRSCPGYPHFTPAEIESRFCYYHVLFILRHREILERGEYPPDPTPTGYTGYGDTRYHAGAKFTRPIEIIAEVDRRLKRTGRAGRTLEHEITVLNAWRPELLSAEARDALYYCCGRDAKRKGFAGWRSGRAWKRRNRETKMSPVS